VPNVLLAPANEGKFHQSILNSAYRLRYEVFHEKMGWDVPISDGMERDHYDDLGAVYVISWSESEVDGFMRLLPTMGSYMLRDTFPQLLGDFDAPSDVVTWEVSRFAVDTKSDYRASAVVTEKLVIEALQFAVRNSIERYVFATSVSLERLLKRFGLSPRRYAKPVKIGSVLSVGCWIDISEWSGFDAFSLECDAIHGELQAGG